MLDRRTMLGAGLAAAGLSTSLGADQALAQSFRTRTSWAAFVNTPSYAKFVATVKKMRANTNPSDPNSWVYWANIHKSYCPHGVPYFLTWHRGYIYRFEQQIRAISGDQAFNLPYWDYYTNANLPKEFTTPGDTSNPLWTKRTNTNVSAALGYGFTQPQYINFPRNWPSPMEPQIESLPHNQVHNIIGGVMPTMLSPEDPIFWVHHGNIDRLWCAWISAGGGRTMPATSDPYWSGGFNYGPTTTGMPKIQTRDTTTTLGYVYDNQRLPTPPAPRTPARPMLRAVPMNGEKALDGVISLGDSQGALTLDDRSFSVSVPLGQQGKLKAGALAAAPPREPAPTELNVVLDEVALTEVGKAGGYFYKVYVNLPAQGGAPEERHLIGTVGAFEIAGALHDHADHGGGGIDGGGKAKLVLPATDVLRGLSPGQISQLVVSFVRVDGANAPKGPAITIGDFSVQAATPAR